MRFDRGQRIFTRTTTKVGETVWVPYIDDWYPGAVNNFGFFTKGGQEYTIVEFSVLGDNDSLESFPLWQLRQRRPSRNGRDKPDEPIPPTHGRPKKIGLSGILTNGGCRGRC